MELKVIIPILVIVLIVLFAAFATISFRPDYKHAGDMSEKVIALPEPKLKGDVSLEEAIRDRRSRRDFKDTPLALEQVSQLLWAAQGITGDGYKRAAPSAGALYPVEAYLVVGEGGVENLGHGVYHYTPSTHTIERVLEGDIRDSLAAACLGQTFVAKAPVSIVIAAEYGRTTGKYGDRGIRYVHMEVGHVGQNIYLQAEALGLGTVVVGAFVDSGVSGLLNLPTNQEPLYVMPVGYPA